MELTLSLWASFSAEVCYLVSFDKVHTKILPLVDPVIILGAKCGILPILGWRARPHILDDDFILDISLQKSAELGSLVSHIFPYPLDPTVTYMSPLAEKFPFVIELESPN